MKVAILGGTFNPLHIAHCMLAETVVKELGFDKVLFVPANIPPHKEIKYAVSAEDRLNMVREFCESSSLDGIQHFFCEDCEIVRQGISYTYDTVCFILEKYKNEIDGKPALILGEESASQFNKWHEAEKLAALVDFIIARRHPDANGIDVKDFSNKPASSYAEDYASGDFRKSFSYPYTLLENPIFPVSSTEIRSRAASGKAFRYLVPSSVFYYIKEHKLYGFNDD